MTEQQTETTAVEQPKNNNAELIVALESLIAFLKERPGFTNVGSGGVKLYAFARSKDELSAVGRTMGGFNKDRDDDSFYLRKDFGAGVMINVFADRNEVCERVVVGKKVIPAEPERTEVFPAKPDREIDIVEWKCPESILRAGDPDEDDDEDEDDTVTVPEPQTVKR